MASIVRHALLALSQDQSPASLRLIAENAENALIHVDEPIDQVIANFARARTLSRWKVPD